MANEKVIGIKFGVAGGGNIEGESGKIIQDQLTEIANSVNLQVKININKPHFKEELIKLKKELDETLGHLNIDVGAAKGKSGGSGGSGGGKAKSDYSSLLKTVNKLDNLKKQMESLEKRGHDSTKEEIKKQFKELEKSYESQMQAAIENQRVTEDEIALLKKHREELEALAEARGKDAKAEDDRKKQKQLTSKQSSWDGVYANAQRLLQRESYLIKNNKEAAKAAEDLQKAMSAEFNPEKNIKKSVEALENLKTALKQADGEFAKIGDRAQTVGFKIKKALGEKIVDKIAYITLLMVSNALRKVYQNVVELDKAVTNLQIATGKSREYAANLVKEYSKLAKQLGATVTDITSAADTWLRQGYDVVEVNKLITNTLMLSKLGQLDSAEAARALTSAMKGYKIEAEDCIKIVDKLTAVDIESATSAGGIATAMAETAASADLAGISMDKLIGYISTVSEVTQDGAESVGTFYKTLFARMGNVQAGALEDLDGESLNEVEDVLDSVGISLRHSNNQFRNFGDVLDEVASKWGGYSDVQQHAIATAFAGTRQQEKFIVLMQNYGDAIKYAEVAANSSGTAQEKYQGYMESLEASLETLSASWQEFSNLILDSSIVKLGVDFLAGIVDLLSRVAEIGDGILVMIPAITVAVSALYALILKIKATNTFSAMMTGLDSILSIFPAIIAGFKLMLANISANIAAKKKLNIETHAHIAALKAEKSAQVALNAVSPAGVFFAIATILTVVIGAIKSYTDSLETAAERSKRYQEEAEKAKEKAEESAKATQELYELIEKYKELSTGIDDANNFNAEQRKEALEIQNAIVNAVGYEAEALDVVNGKINDNIEAMTEFLRVMAEENYNDSVDSYYAALNNANNAHPTYNKGDITGAGAGMAEKFYQFLIDSGNDGISGADDLYDIIANMGNEILISKDGTIGDKFYGINLKTNSPEEAIKTIDEVLKRMRERGARDTEAYQVMNSIKEQYEAFITQKNNALSSVAESAASWYGMSNYQSGLSIESIGDYNTFRENLIKQIAGDENIKKIGVGVQAIETEVDNWLSTYFPKWYNKANNNMVTTKKTVVSILGEIEKEFDALSKALKEIEDEGVLSAKTLENLFKEYEGLEKYFQITPDGYKIASAYSGMSMYDILSDYVKGYLQPYYDALGECEEGTENFTIAQNNLNNAIIAGATLLRTAGIEEATKGHNEQIDKLNEELDAHKELIDIRRELLKTYQEEVKYTDELSKKQKNVADLRTMLALSELDTSAAGRARTRQLKKDLEESQNELDDFTLEHAIDVLTQQLNDEYDENKKFIQGEVDRLKAAIEEIAKNYKVVINGIEYAGTPEYHTGGFVGGDSTLKSNEEFAKLMNGELVITPAQMNHFMNDTFPKLLSGGVSGGEINYNAPLISIECENITKDTLPDLEKIINQAVNKIKAEIDSAFSRTGFKKKI